LSEIVAEFEPRSSDLGKTFRLSPVSTGFQAIKGVPPAPPKGVFTD